MKDKTDEQILNEIEVYCSNSLELLKRSREIHVTALDLHNIDVYIAEMKRSVEFQKLSIGEMQKAFDLQHSYYERLVSSQNLKSKFGLF